MKLSTYVLGVPAAAIAAVVAVANRQNIHFSLDPTSQTAPAIAFDVPLFVLLFLVLVIGVLLGGIASSLSRLRKPPKSAKTAKQTLPLKMGSLKRLLPWSKGGSKTARR
ncbi:MAG: hypothetical protein HY243_10540 [Proteobacteria bacterium]|nr:hypothetical protein [Pseudomonadota bacterium]